MRIALVSTCALATPPKAYGGTELVVAELAKGLTTMGHKVTVYATGDSEPAGEKRSFIDKPVWPPQDLAELRHAAFAWRDIHNNRFDIVHVHHPAALPFCKFVGKPCVATLHHERTPDLVEHYRAFPEVEYVAISESQAKLCPELKFARVIHHGLDPLRYPGGAGDGDHVTFLGRFAPEKAPHLALDAAAQAGVPLCLGGAAHPVAAEYFEREVLPRLQREQGRAAWLGELSHEPKVELLRQSRALLFPIQWNEPFGLVMIEAMLVGTPVIAFDSGSAPEVIDEGITGFLVRSVDEMAARIRALDNLDRKQCRKRAIERFSAFRMTAEHVALYQRILSQGERGLNAHAGPKLHPHPSADYVLGNQQ